MAAGEWRRARTPCPLLAGGTEKVSKVGERFIEQPGVVGQARNAGATPATLLTIHVLPKGAALTTPALPSTGGGGLARRAPSPVVLALLAGLLLAGGWGLHRRVGRA